MVNNSPCRFFYTKTEKKNVYPENTLIPYESSQSDASDEESFFRNHVFDMTNKNRKSYKRKRTNLDFNVNRLHGVQSIREIGFKINETKIPATERI